MRRTVAISAENNQTDHWTVQNTAPTRSSRTNIKSNARRSWTGRKKESFFDRWNCSAGVFFWI